jgi:hypothetical protein
MNVMDNRQIKILLVIFLLVSTVVATKVIISGKKQTPVPSLAAKPLPTASIKPTGLPSVTQKVDVGSPDGKMTLSMYKKTVGADSLWTFLVGDTRILSETIPMESNFSIPFNVFSPDNKYIFLGKETSGETSYLVAKTDGSAMSKVGQIVEINSLFSQKYSNYKITDVTGWAAPTLIVVNTDNIDGVQGPSFWFDVQTHSFIQLSSRFN